MAGRYLSTREQRALELLACGFTVPEMVPILRCSLPEARAATQRVREKTAARTQANAIALAFSLGLLDPQGNYEKEAWPRAGNRPSGPPESVSNGAR